jgi:tRNA(Ile)-lysidine synthetase-like protein
MVLLHMLTRLSGVRLTVAHFDHGIRSDSIIDRRLVQLTAQQYDLPFVSHQGKLGPGASEARARAARYDFLHQVRTASGAQAVITAHHQDDVLETAILNLLRGTGRRGLSSLRSTDTLVRPLLCYPKDELLRYATEQGLVWREDSTNADTTYLRNHVRLRLLPRFAPADRASLLAIIERAGRHNSQLTDQVGNYLHMQPARDILNRHDFIMLPHVVARDVLAEWLRLRSAVELSRKLLERLVVAAKTGRSGSRVNVSGRYWLEIRRDTLALRTQER